MISVDQQIGRYKILSTLGAGGMGEVFLAQDTELDRLAAIKILPKDFSAVSERVHRFIQEAKAVSALNHPNILTIYEVGLEHGTRFIVSEYIKGETLREKLKKEYLKIPKALDYGLQIASALESAHSQSIIHRDIKPENIMIREDNLVKVLDFGLAKLSDTANQDLFNSQTPTREHIQTKSGMIIGTFSYMSPEQARGKPVDFRTDVFSLGVVLYEMLTGVQPFYGETSSDIIAAILKSEPEEPSAINAEVFTELETIVLKSLEKSREKRFQSVAEVAREIKNLKLEVDFKRKSFDSGKSLRASFDAKTKILDVDTSRIPHAITKENEDKPSAPSLLSRITSKITNPTKIQTTWYLLPILAITAVIILLAVIFRTGYSNPPPTAAVKLYDDGVSALREGTYYKAGKLFEEAVKLDENYIKAHAALAETWLEMDYFGRAQNEMLRVNELEKSGAGLLPSFGQTDDSLYFQAVNALVLRDYPKAITVYQELARRNPNSASVYLDLGRTLEKNNQTDLALENFRKASELDPQSGAAMLRIGILQRRKAEFEQALQSFEAAEAFFDRQSNDEAIAEVRLQRGISFNIQEKAADARAQFEQVINMLRANSHQKIRAMLQISGVCAGEGKSDCAEQYASNAIKIAQDERMENVATDGLIDLGNAFLARGDYDKAEQNFLKAIDFARKDEGLRNESRALLALASLRIQQKKPDESEDFAQKAIAFFQKGNYNKELTQGNIILGRAQEMKNNFDDALKAFEQVENSENAPLTDRAYAKMVGGNVLLKTEKYPAALHKFEESFDLYKSLNSAFYMTYTLIYLSEVSSKLGLFEKSREHLQQAENLSKDNESLLRQVETRKHFLDAQIALSKQDFGEAIRNAKLIDISKGGSDLFTVNTILCLAQPSTNPKNPTVLQSCFNALKYAEERGDLFNINFAKLLLAKAYINAGDNSKALDSALSVKDYFVSKNLNESVCRAWIIASQAKFNLGDKETSKEFSSKARDIFNQLKSDWGDENFSNYLSNPEINVLYKQAENLSRS